MCENTFMVRFWGERVGEKEETHLGKKNVLLHTPFGGNGMLEIHRDSRREVGRDEVVHSKAICHNFRSGITMHLI